MKFFKGYEALRTKSEICVKRASGEQQTAVGGSRQRRWKYGKCFFRLEINVYFIDFQNVENAIVQYTHVYYVIYQVRL